VFHKPLLTTLLLTAILTVGCQQPTAKSTAVTYKSVTGVITTVPPSTPVVIQVTPAPQPPAPAAPPAPKVNTSPWIGKSIDDIVSAIGNFRAEVDMGNGVHAFQFQAKPKKPRCVASYLASRENDDKPWIVEEYIAPDPKTC